MTSALRDLGLSAIWILLLPCIGVASSGPALIGGVCHSEAEVSGANLDAEINARLFGGVSFVNQVSPRTAAAVDILYARKGPQVVHTTYGLHYLLVSPHARIGISSRGPSPVYLLLGAELGVLLGATADFNRRRARESVDIIDSFKRVDVCGLVGLGFEVASLNQPLFVEARYSHGLLNVGHAVVDWKNRTFSLLVGVHLGATDAKPN